MEKLSPSVASAIDHRVTKEADAIIKDKREKYSGTEDPYRNFRIAGMVAGVEPCKTVLMRMADKLSRIRTMIEAGLTEEEWEDLMKNDYPDLVNYTRILAGMTRELTLEVEC